MQLAALPDVVVGHLGHHVLAELRAGSLVGLCSLQGGVRNARRLHADHRTGLVGRHRGVPLRAERRGVHAGGNHR